MWEARNQSATEARRSLGVLEWLPYAVLQSQPQSTSSTKVPSIFRE